MREVSKAPKWSSKNYIKNYDQIDWDCEHQIAVIDADVKNDIHTICLKCKKKFYLKYINGKHFIEPYISSK